MSEEELAESKRPCQFKQLVPPQGPGSMFCGITCQLEMMFEDLFWLLSNDWLRRWSWGV